MVILKKYNHTFFLVKFKLDSDDFEKAIDVIKFLPVRLYKSVLKGWLIPIIDLPTLLDILDTYHFEYKFRGNISKKYIRQHYKQILGWRKEQLGIKKYYRSIDPDSVISKWYSNQMDVLNKNLFSFQAFGSYFAFNSDASIICDPVGLGKSAQALACAEKRMDEEETNFNLIICPSTLKKNWAEEIEKFTDKKYTVVSGEKSKRKRMYRQSYLYDYMIINYDVLFNDYDEIYEFMLDKDGYKINLIIDEIQYINNRKSKRAKAVKLISDECLYILGLSATLLENKITDLYNNFLVIDESVFGDKTQYANFVHKFCEVDYWGTVTGYKNKKVIKQRMAPYFIRRLKEDVEDELPDRVENNFWIELSTEHRKVYNDVKKKIVDEIEDIERKRKIVMADIFPMVVYLRQCLLSTSLIGHKHNYSAKTDELLNIIKMVGRKGKFVLFCHFPLMIELLKEKMDEIGLKSMAMHATKKYKNYCDIDDRVPLIKKFNEDKSYRMLITSDILREGVNILSANYIVNFDLLYNPAKMEQRVGRLDRIGTKHKTINIINIIAQKTVDENVYERIKSKREMSADILDNRRQEKRLTMRDVMEVYELRNK